MGSVNLDNTGSGSAITLSSDGTSLLLDGTAVGGGGADLLVENYNGTSTLPTATGNNAVGLGVGATAAGNYSVALGGQNTSTAGNNTTAIGSFAEASTGNSTALGYSSDASGMGSVSIGDSFASSTSAVAIGQLAFATTGTRATAMPASRASGTDSFAVAIGSNSSSYGASGSNSIAMGYQSKATEANSIAIGDTAISTTANQIALGGATDTVKISDTYTLPTADGTNGQVMTTNGSGAVTFADAAGGVTGFTSADNTSSPNNTVNVVSFTAASSSTNAGIAIVPKGTGSFSLAIPDGTTAGGDARGSYAIDLSLGRTNANRVASGSKSVGIGYNTRANGQGGVAIAGAGNICQGSYGVALGYDSNVYGSYSTVINAGGSGTDGGSSYALALGNGSKAGAEGSGAVIRGYTETKNTFAIGTKDKLFTQRVTGNLYGITPNATPTTISTKGLNQTVSKANFPTIAAGDSSSGMYAATIKGILHAIDDTNNEIRVWEFCRSFKMHDNVKSAVGNTVKNLLVSDGTTMANTDFSIELSSGTRTIIFTVTGVASTNIRWNAHYTIYQTKYE